MIKYSIRNEGVGGSSPSCGTTKSIQNQSVRSSDASIGLVFTSDFYTTFAAFPGRSSPKRILSRHQRAHGASPAKTSTNDWIVVLTRQAGTFLCHTAIVTGIHAGISIETLAMNARTSTDMIDRFYGSHVLSALDKGTEIVDSVHAKQERYAANGRSGSKPKAKKRT